MAIQDISLSRRRFVRTSLALAAVPVGASVLAACGGDDSASSQASPKSLGDNVSENVKGLTPAQALDKLKEGNKRFVDLKNKPINVSRERRVRWPKGNLPLLPSSAAWIPGYRRNWFSTWASGTCS